MRQSAPLAAARRHVPAPASTPSHRIAVTAALALMALFATHPLSAQELGTPMTGAEFEAYTSGKTLTFGIDGQPYGVEQYLPDRRVRWAFIGEECRDGQWFETGQEICFIYHDDPVRLHCWEFHDTGSGLLARIRGSDSSGLVEVAQSPEPMFCPGPQIGA